MRTLTLLFFLALPSLNFAQLPEWAQSYGSTLPFPRTTHLAGFGIAAFEGSEGTALDNAKAQATSDLIKKLQVTVSSDMISISKEVDGKFSSSLMSVVQSVSTLQLEGVEYLTAKDGKNFYALAFVKRAELGEAYTRAHQNRASSAASGVGTSSGARKAKSNCGSC